MCEPARLIVTSSASSPLIRSASSTARLIASTAASGLTMTPLRKGVIVNPDAAVDAIKRAVEDAERMSGLEAEEVTINLAGSHILGFNGQAIVAVSGRDREIVAEDVRR